MPSDLQEKILKVLRRKGTATIGAVQRVLGHKHETIARAMVSLEKEGHVYGAKEGRVTYYTLVPSRTVKRVRPAISPEEKKGENKCEVYARPSWPHHRSISLQERIPEPGTVLWPTVKGSDLSREWVRVHHNGQYHVLIQTTGKFVTFNPETLDTFSWKKSALNTNYMVSCKVNPHKMGETVPYSVKTVSNSMGVYNQLDIYVHPRYVFLKGHEQTMVMEFRAQVDDVLTAMEGIGWMFDRDSVWFTGDHHTAVNDPVLGSLVGTYNESSEDVLHFDHSHGIPEVEVYGQDPETVEMMVRLPEIIKAFGSSIHALNLNMAEVVDIQMKMVQALVPRTQEVSPVPPLNDARVMFG